MIAMYKIATKNENFPKYINFYSDVKISKNSGPIHKLSDVIHNINII